MGGSRIFTMKITQIDKNLKMAVIVDLRGVLKSVQQQLERAF